MVKKDIKKFQTLVWSFYKKNKRNFPWRKTKNPYKILVSEVMLQQTQTDRVVPYYTKWLERFPNFASLASASFSEIYPYWQGLGYNRRAMALKKTAEKSVKDYDGKLPENFVELQTFPGIGPYTAKAVAIFAYNRPLACIETNIRRLFIHHFFQDQEGVDDHQILAVAEEVLDTKNPREWHYALMDYGAYLKTAVPNPNRRSKNYAIQPKFEGSLRQIRGAILRNLMQKEMTAAQLIKAIGKDSQKTRNVLVALGKEELITKNKSLYSLK